MPDIWKDVRGYEGLYVVSDSGQIKSIARTKPYLNGVRKRQEQIMRWHLVNGGYAQLMLTNKRGERHSYLVHRIVAEAFVPNPSNLPQVNHIDGNKLNNRAENLEWCTAKENMVHSLNSGLRTDAKLVDMFSKNGEYICTYPSIKEAGRKTGVHHQNISLCCIGKTKSAGGYLWRYHSGGETNEHTR